MIERRQISESQARAAIKNGDFAPEITAAGPRVALILTQSWCPQWPAMEKWIRGLQRDGKPADFDIIVYEFVYDRVEFARQFTSFKERVLGNSMIPYVRYYRDGKLIDESNYLGSRDFVAKFN